MMRSKWLWVYIVLTVFIGYVSGGGMLGAISMALLGPGAVMDEIVTPHGEPHNAAVMYGVSLAFWIAVWAWFKIHAPAAPQAPREVSVIRTKSYEVEEPPMVHEPSLLRRPRGYE